MSRSSGIRTLLQRPVHQTGRAVGIWLRGLRVGASRGAELPPPGDDNVSSALRAGRTRARLCRARGVAALSGVCIALHVMGASARERSPAPAAIAENPSYWARGAVNIGRGLRFNNPYRLATPLGETAESVSLSATYLELAAALLRDLPAGMRHGIAIGGSFAVQGIEQLVLTPSYALELEFVPGAALRGRVGVPVVVAPDATLGLEAALGQGLELGWGIGVAAELVGSVFFGAATEQVSITTIPLLSLQIGVTFQHEVVF